MTARLEVAKTYKLFIAGAFPRGESGRTIALPTPDGSVLAHISLASRKDLRDAAEAARTALPKWSGATAYNRGQVLYRMAEMLEGRKDEFAALLLDRPRDLPETALPQKARAVPKPRSPRPKAKPTPSRMTRPQAEREVAAAIDRLVSFGGWADKYAQVLGCNNPVAGPYYNFTTPEPTGVVGVVAPDHPALLGLISLIAPPLCAGNTIIALGSQCNPLPTAVLGEVCAVSDIPPGVINLLTGTREELVPHFAAHRGIDAIHAAGVSPEHESKLREGVAENLKRVRILSPHPPAARRRPRENGERIDWFDDAACHSPWMIEPFVEMKTVWHPSGA